MTTVQEKNEMRPHIVACIAEWCRRPRMYLVGLPDYNTINVSYIRAMLDGFRLGAMGTPAEDELRDFVDWVEKKLPGAESCQWFGEVLVHRFDGNHERAAEQILEWAEEYLEEHGMTPAG